MAVLKNTNKNPRFTNYLVANNLFHKELNVVDVGARGGFEGHWKWFKDKINLIGFEADEVECNRLNNQNTGMKKSFYPVILGKKKEVRNFYTTNYPPSSGLYAPNIKFLKRFPDLKNLTIKKTSLVKTISLDQFLNSQKITNIDFIKLDVEGAEMDVLKGAQKVLKSSVKGLSIEIELLPLRKNQAVFRDIDKFLNDLGFRIYDLTIYRHQRINLSTKKYAALPGRTDQGQVLWGQALYFKDYVENLPKKNNFQDLIKLASLFEVVNLNDCALELMELAFQKKVISRPIFNTLRDLLVPEINGKIMSFNEYQQYLKKQTIESNNNILINRRVNYIKKFIPLYLRKIIYTHLISINKKINLLLKTS